MSVNRDSSNFEQRQLSVETNHACCGLRTVICCNSRNNSRVNKIIFLFTSSAILCVAVGICVSVVLFNSKFENVDKTEYAPYDMKLFKEKYKGIFCEQYTVNSEYDFVIRVYDQEPKIDKSSYIGYEMVEDVLLEVNDVYYLWFYLLQGSRVNFSSYGEISYRMYIIKGTENFEDWRNNNLTCKTNNCEKDIHVAPDDKTVTALMNSKEDDYYYFAYAFANREGTIVGQYNINRTAFYKYDSYEMNCNDIVLNTCDIDIPFLKDTWIVIKAEEIKGFYRTQEIQITCKSRAWSFLILFIILPTLICIIVNLIIWCCCLKQRAENQSINVDNNGEDSPLLQNGEQPPSYDEISPPKYEDIVNINDEAPPSYHDIVHNETITAST